ncbi:MAG: alpha-ketoacid dehydrogenase subunit alpha/beta [Actinomycetota bacterium]
MPEAMPRAVVNRYEGEHGEPSGLMVSPEQVIADYRIAYRSRILSLVGTKEVHSGRASFGIFGDGKELAEIAMAKAFKDGDIRAGYYRDQTFMLATGMSDPSKLFAQLYANPDTRAEPASGGRQMNNHFATRFLDDAGHFKLLTDKMHSSADISPTGGQMARLLGLAYASKLYRSEPALRGLAAGFSVNGNEVAFGTIGDAGTSEGVFFETINAAGVLQVPMAITVYDDGYGISVPSSLQTTKSSISAALKGFEWDAESGTGLDIHVVRGWDYPALCVAYAAGIEKVRLNHVPALFHIIEMTQPQGHSSSGSHERYKSKERLRFEVEYDPIARMRAWMIDRSIASAGALERLEEQDQRLIDRLRRAAYRDCLAPIRQELAQALKLVEDLHAETGIFAIGEVAGRLKTSDVPTRRLIRSSAFDGLVASRGLGGSARDRLKDFLRQFELDNDRRFNSHLHSESDASPLLVPERKPVYRETSDLVDGRVVLQRCFEHNLKRDARLFIVGEDVGRLGDVNLVYQGLSDQYGDLRVTDTGIREATILGQGIGAAMRGLRPIVDIQYLDYLPCALQVMTDDLATLHHRTAGGQKAPVIIRTKGHRLEGIWHSGSPMGMILHSCRGIYIGVPRNMTQAAGMYNTLIQGDNPGLVIEVLGGYRVKERVPDNAGTFTVPFGVPEVIRRGSDLTLVTYGACCAIALDAAAELSDLGVEIEVIDVQTLSPFDRRQLIVRSVARTNSVLFLDEDVPGGASAFMMQQVLEVQQGWMHLDSAPRTLTGKANRSSYGVDGGYFSKPNKQDIVRTCYEIVWERDPRALPPLI